RVEHEARAMSSENRLGYRWAKSQPLWDELHVWLKLERSRVADGSAIAKALAYSINHWPALTAHLQDGQLPVDNNHIENLMRPWAMACS
ncbi:MAG: transposase, partial [Caldimonas sp.]